MKVAYFSNKGLYPRWGLAMAVAGSLLLSACGHTGYFTSSDDDKQDMPAKEESAPPSVAPPVPTKGDKPVDERARVALLLPLSGPGSDVGQAMLDAAQMAVFDHAGAKFELLPRDTGASAAAAAQEAVNDGATLVLGPLFGSDVPAVRDVAVPKGVPVISFSSDKNVAGSGVFMMGFTPADDVRRVVSYAQDQGLKTFAAVVPDTAYGAAVVEGFPAESLVQTGRYSAKAVDTSPAIKAVADGAAQKPFQAIMLADNVKRLRELAPLLSYHDIDTRKIHVLGTGVWDEGGLETEPALIGGWFAAPMPDARLDFEQRFAKLYGHKPPRLASLAYDATSLAAVLARLNEGRFDSNMLKNQNGFAGVDGIFRFREDGTAERGLAILEVSPRGVVVRDPAPRRFTPTTN